MAEEEEVTGHDRLINGVGHDAAAALMGLKADRNDAGLSAAR